MESQNKNTSPSSGWWNTDMSLIAHVREVESQQTQPQTPKSDQQQKKWKPRDKVKEKGTIQPSEQKNFSQNKESFQGKEQKKKQIENFDTFIDERTVTFAEDQQQETIPKVYRPKQQTPGKSPSNATKNWKGKPPSRHDNSTPENQRRRSKSFTDNNSQPIYNSVPYTYESMDNKSQTPQPISRKVNHTNNYPQSNPIPVGSRSAPPAAKKSKPKSRVCTLGLPSSSIVVL